MADTTITIGSSGLAKKVHDFGDGTYGDAIHLESAAVAVNVDLDVEASDLGAHAEDAAHVSGDVGVMALAVSAATPTARAGTAGDYQPLSVDSVDGSLFTRHANASYGTRVSLTRTADTNAYTANDVVGAATDSTAALTFALAPAAGGQILITSAALEIDVAAVPSGMTTFNLHLYNVTPPSALGDNVPWDLPAGDRTAYLGVINLGTPVDVGSTLWVQQDGINMQVTAASGNIFGYLVTVGAYTPSSAAVKAVTLHSVRL